MAEYTCSIRTNYFQVKDPDAFRNFMERVYGTWPSIDIWEEKNDAGKQVFGFGAYGSICGVRDAIVDEIGDEDSDESSYDEFIEGLQEHVAEGDAIILLEAGNERLRYVVGSATIITSREYKYIDITQSATVAAVSMLNDPNWTTKCEY